MDKENRMEAIRNLSLTKMEEHYAMKIEKLVDEMKLEDAEALCQEMTFEGEEGEDCDLFLDDLTDWLDQPFPGTDLRFYDKMSKEDRQTRKELMNIVYPNHLKYLKKLKAALKRDPNGLKPKRKTRKNYKKK